MKNVAVFLATGFEEIEALTVVDLLRRSGINTKMVSITDDLLVYGAHDIKVLADCIMEQIDFDSIHMIVLPGGMPGTTNLEQCELLLNQLERFFDEGKFISAICAAPKILGRKGMLVGKKACCYPGMEEYLQKAIVTKNEVEIDGNIITSRGMGCAIAFSLAIITVLLGKEKASIIKEAIVFEQNR